MDNASSFNEIRWEESKKIMGSLKTEFSKNLNSIVLSVDGIDSKKK